jgi:radical SAM superfamily enzyme YgiQ (UPF0313 family)
MAFIDPLHIANEMERHATAGISRFFLFSENFLYRRSHFLQLLDEIDRRGLSVRIGAPKGMEPRLLDAELLAQMKKTGWQGLRLALETKSDAHRRALGRPHNTCAEYERAIALACDAGFDTREIGTFLLYGTPNESLDEVGETAEYIHSRGSYIIPMAFTPVPRSRIYQQYQHLLFGYDLVDLSGSLYPFAEFNGCSFEEYARLPMRFAALNQSLADPRGEGLTLDAAAPLYEPAFARSEVRAALGL